MFPLQHRQVQAQYDQWGKRSRRAAPFSTQCPPALLCEAAVLTTFHRQSQLRSLHQPRTPYTPSLLKLASRSVTLFTPDNSQLSTTCDLLQNQRLDVEDFLSKIKSHQPIFQDADLQHLPHRPGCRLCHCPGHHQRYYHHHCVHRSDCHRNLVLHEHHQGFQRSRQLVRRAHHLVCQHHHGRPRRQLLFPRRQLHLVPHGHWRCSYLQHNPQGFRQGYLDRQLHHC